MAGGESLQPPGDASQCKRMEEEDHTSAAGVWWETSHRLLNGAVVPRLAASLGGSTGTKVLLPALLVGSTRIGLSYQSHVWARGGQY